jgi:hypothetical protein
LSSLEDVPGPPGLICMTVRAHKRRQQDNDDA